MSTIKTYSDLIKYSSFDHRLEYLKLRGAVGKDTFGFDRIFNQMFYQSVEWKRVREYVLLRDQGCDLGVPGYDIFEKYIIHHINPITLDDINDKSDLLLDPENLITTSHSTHNAIHYGNSNAIPVCIERKPNDTCPWLSK